MVVKNKNNFSKIYKLIGVKKCTELYIFKVLIILILILQIKRNFCGNLLRKFYRIRLINKLILQKFGISYNF